MSTPATITPFVSTLKAAGVDAFSIVAPGDNLTEGGFLVSEESLTGIETMLASNSNTIEELNAEVSRVTNELNNSSDETAAQTIADLNEQVTSLTTERDVLLAEKTEWGKKSSGNGSTVVTKEDNKASTGLPAWYRPDGTENAASKYRN